MKWNFRKQQILSIVCIVLLNVVGLIMKGHWIYRTLGFGLAGLPWVFHPILPDTIVPTKNSLLWVRVIGICIILFGLIFKVGTGV